MVLMIVGGIGLAQAVSDPKQVTLQWLRLGGLIAVTLLAVQGTLYWVAGPQPGPWFWVGWTIVTGAFTYQLVTVQLAQRVCQRVAALLGCLACVPVTGAAILHGVTGMADGSARSHAPVFADTPIIELGMVSFLGAGLVGGCLMTMLLGHAYLAAGGDMSQKPFARLVIIMAALIGCRIVISILFGLRPYLQSEDVQPRTWLMLLITTRYLVGLGVPGLFTYMIADCVKRRANQSATGILYVTLVLIILGEGTALTLFERTGQGF